ncbi:TM2 domain-containing protein [Psychroflexus aestuariivivens]|uniref:TM2 domain-containing protein n=1 Tax=Psychroflexus aestuariivivens TaxID=1795040 RepID=UPI000FD9B070|nr:TM2 domain-containing protein [Psychroflexus aestuariivivens]
MKNLLFVAMLLTSSLMFASFPVNKQNVAKDIEQFEIQSESDFVNTLENAEIKAPSSEDAVTPIAVAGYDKWVAVALWFFLGGFAAHRWYAGKPVWANILFIITLGGLGIWAIVDLINILTDNFQ